MKLLLVFLLGNLSVALPAPAVMLAWNCNACPYSTSVTEGKLYLEDGFDARGSLEVNHISGEGGKSSSLEIRGPITGVKSARTEVRIHEGTSCDNPGDIVYFAKCRNCQKYISMKILDSIQSLSLGDGSETDVEGKVVIIHDQGSDRAVGCGKISLKTE